MAVKVHEPGAAALVERVGTVCHSKTSNPRLRAANGFKPFSAPPPGKGANRAAAARVRAFWSASAEPLPLSRVAVRGRPAASTTTWTTLLVNNPAEGHDCNS